MRNNIDDQIQKIQNLLEIKKCIEEVKTNYRPYDPGNYLYKQLLKTKQIKDKFTDKYIELIYTTLSAWNMNSRGAKLANFDVFLKTLQSNKHKIIPLSKFKLHNLDNPEEILAKLHELFDCLELVGTNHNGDSKPLLVTFSKTMHFLLPDLIVPIDRSYTLKFFYNNTLVPKLRSKQFNKFMQLFKLFLEYASTHSELKSKIDKNWNQNIPKIIDNIIIGYVRRHKEAKTK